MNWLRKKYGDRVISAVLHLDEATPHLQFLILPLDDNGRLNCRKLFGGSRRVMADLQTDYAQAVAHLSMKRGQFQKSPASDNHWPMAREFFVERMKLPAAVIDQAHEDSLVYSDRRKNCVFFRERDSGAYVINTQGKPFTRSLGQDGGPFMLSGSVKAVYITNTPIEALSFKAIHPDSTIMATGGLMLKDKL